MQDGNLSNSNTFLAERAEDLKRLIAIDKKYYEKENVKRGLRNSDGTGVVAGVSKICNVRGYILQDGERVPTEGNLSYRGIDINDLVSGFVSEGRFGFEETVYLLLFGSLPNKTQLDGLSKKLTEFRVLPDRFMENTIMSAPSSDIMNKLSRSILALYSYDPTPEPHGLEYELIQALYLVARCPSIVANAYSAKRHYFDGDSLVVHMPQPELSMAENFLYAIRKDTQYSAEEARLLDLCMVLHAEHGGGNNSTFTCRVLSSSGTDIYSSISGAVGSLKGPRHGGANKKVMDMMETIKANVKNWNSDDEIRDFLRKILRGEAGDGSGLIYGIGHAVYTLSDPRTILLKSTAKRLAAQKGFGEEFMLYENVERLAPEVFYELKGDDKVVSANVDLYSGFVYNLIGIPEELYTAMFAMSRIVGWCAHRIEEVYNPNKIIRPAYRVVAPKTSYQPIGDR